MLSAAGPASAAPATDSASTAVRASGAAPVSDAAAAPLPLSCPSGSVCVWPNVGGTSQRCSWSNADNDWRNAPVTCSWSASQPVRAIKNSGTSSSYDIVCLYTGANYTGSAVLAFQGGGEWTSSSGIFLRSHRWRSPSQPCP